MFRRGPSPSRATPRHLSAGPAPAHRAPGPSVRRPTIPSAAARHRAEAAQVRSRLALAVAADEAPIARVPRSRLALAVAVSLAALPVIVLDNLPATAEARSAVVDVESSAADERSPSEPSTPSTTETAPSTTTTEAPSTTTARATIMTDAPAIEVVVERALVAPAPTAPPDTAAPPPAASTGPGPGDPSDPATWDRLAHCESSGYWGMNSGNGYYGGLQFSLATWRSVGGAGYPHQAGRDEQIDRGRILQARAGWGQWPSCSRRLGYL